MTDQSDFADLFQFLTDLTEEEKVKDHHGYYQLEHKIKVKNRSYVGVTTRAKDVEGLTFFRTYGALSVFSASAELHRRALTETGWSYVPYEDVCRLIVLDEAAKTCTSLEDDRLRRILGDVQDTGNNGYNYIFNWPLIPIDGLWLGAGVGALPHIFGVHVYLPKEGPPILYKKDPHKLTKNKADMSVLFQYVTAKFK